MKFKEFSSPLEKDYDIFTSLNNEENKSNNNSSNKYLEQLIDLIGILEDIDEEELFNQYGITLNEYFHPTAETIVKVTQKLNSTQSVKHR